MNAALLRAALVLCLATAGLSAQTPVLRTVAERSSYTETAKHADVLAFCDELRRSQPSNIWFTDYGTSKDGQKLPLLVLGTNGLPLNAEVAKAEKRFVLMAFANIHAGEVDGKEALLALARDLAGSWGTGLWKNAIVLLAPNINPDGNDKIDKRNRTEQNGPTAGVGTRANADGFDLNRDFVKLETPEIRALTKLIDAWDPRVIIDCHTTNGSYHRYTLTYDGPRYPAAHPALVEYTQKNLLPDAGKRVKAATGFDTFWYGNFDQTRTRWETYPAGPRFGVQWIALRGRFGILSESYSYASYKDRVTASYHFVKGIFEHALANADEIRRVTDLAVQPQAEIALRTKTVSEESPVSILGFVEQVQDGRRRPTGQLKEYNCNLLLKMQPTVAVARPPAYVLAPRCLDAVHVLKRHGITVTELLEDVHLPVQAMVVEKVNKESRPFQKHTLVSVDAQSEATATRLLPAGSFVVSTDQPLGQLAAYLLEPASEDGLTTWNFFDADLRVGKEFPVVRLMTDLPLHTGPTAPLPEDVKPPQFVTFEAAMAKPQIGAMTLGAITWLPDGEHFLSARQGKLLKINAKTGNGEPFADPKQIEKSLSAIAKLPKDVIEQQSKSTNFRYTPNRDGFYFNIGSDFAVGYFDGKPGVRLTTDGRPKEFPTFNKDGSRFAYVSQGNLYAVEIASAKITALTTDGGKDEILNGRGDWVYEEEIFNRNGRAYWWSPDGQSIAFMRFDDRPVTKFPITDFSTNRGKLEQWNYPKSGDANPHVKIGIATPATGKVAFLDLGDYKPADVVISRVGWTPKGQPLVYMQNREQTWLDVLVWNDMAGKPVKLFRETTKAWVEDPGEPQFLPDGTFLFLSERSGYKHLYHYAADGTLKGQITDGPWEVKTVLRVDPKEGYVYFNGTKDGFTRSHFYRVELASKTVERLTPAGGTHTISLAPQGKLFVCTSSDNDKPPTAVLREIGGGVIRTLDNNPARDRGQFRTGKTERVQILLKDGFVLEGSITYPPEFDAKKKYPIWVNTYAGPHAPTVRDGWGGRMGDQALSRQDLILFRVDPRSASGKGAAASWACFRQLGVQELKDLEEAVLWLGQKGFADTTRVGISGHSYGGFMSGYALTHGSVFTAGIASGPVTDWHLYDSIYTERYMGLPSDNKEGYDKTSVVKAAKNLHGKLLIMHGMIDDNVHVQNSMQLVDALQRANKQFELMVYPKNRHGIGGPHYQRTQFEFILRSLGLTEKK